MLRVAPFASSRGRCLSPPLCSSSARRCFGPCRASLSARKSLSQTIGEYNATTGATENAVLVSGLSSPIGLAVSGSNLYVVNNGSNTIGEYDATTGASENPSLVSGLAAQSRLIQGQLTGKNTRRVDYLAGMGIERFPTNR